MNNPNAQGNPASKIQQRRESAKYSAKELAIEWNENPRKFNMEACEIYGLVHRFGSHLVHDAMRLAYSHHLIGHIASNGQFYSYIRGYCEGRGVK